MELAKQKSLALRVCLLLAGAATLAFGLFNVHSQSQITEGGVLGLTLLLQHWFHLSPGISAPVLDVSCYLLGLRFLGAGFLKWALAGSAAFSAFYNLFEHFGYALPNLGGKPLLAAVAGDRKGVPMPAFPCLSCDRSDRVDPFRQLYPAAQDRVFTGHGHDFFVFDRTYLETNLTNSGALRKQGAAILYALLKKCRGSGILIRATGFCLSSTEK